MFSSFVFRFLLANAAAMTFLIFIIAIKKIFQKHFSPRTQYYLWIPAFLALFAPFLPINALNAGFNNLKAWLLTFFSQQAPASIIAASPQSESISPNVSGIVKDFAVSVAPHAYTYISDLLLAAWIIGMCCTTLIALQINWKTLKLRQASSPVENQELLSLFKRCKLLLNIKTKIEFRSSADLQSPITFGTLKPCILIPTKLVAENNLDSLRFILLHELCHCKCRDSIMNNITCLLGIIYWHCPLMHYIKKEIRLEREIACDTAVLHALQPSEHIAYGNTLINFAESITAYAAASSIGGSQTQIKKRIINIASYRPETFLSRIKGLFIFILSCIMVFACAPYLSVNAASEQIYHFQEKNYANVDYSSYFKNEHTDFEGSFVLYDLEQDAWQIYNREQSAKRVSPNSTYKIYSALCALEEDIITPSNNALPWDKAIYPIESWNHNQTLQSAMQNSVNWYFQKLDARNGTAKMQQFFRQIQYGNADLSGGITDYWLESSLKISPIEQVILLKQLYLNEFEFEKENIEAIKSSMLITTTPNYSLYGKTGTGMINDHAINGWFIGFTKSSNHTYFFAANIQGKDNANGLTAFEITQNILKETAALN